VKVDAVRTVRGEALRYLLAGGLNTLFSYALYWALLGLFPYAVAYTVAFCAGILSSYALNTYYVFGGHWSWRKLCAFPVVHVTNYLVGVGVLAFAVQLLDIDPRLAPLLSIAATIPVGFVLSRYILSDKSGSSGRAAP